MNLNGVLIVLGHFGKKKVAEHLRDGVGAVRLPDGKNIHVLVFTFEGDDRQIRGRPECPDDGLRKDRDPDPGRDEDHESFRIGGTGIDLWYEAGFTEFVRDDAAVFFRGGVIVVFRQKKGFAAQIIAPDGRKLGIWVAGRKDSVQPVAGDLFEGKAAQVGVSVGDIKDKIKTVLLQVHEEVQMGLTEQREDDGGVLQVELSDEGGNQGEPLSLYITDAQ